VSIEFNKKLMLDNITFMLKKLGKKIGELEDEAGVSTGYISRLSKEEANTKPGIDFVVNVAKSLKISVDTLVNIDMAGLSPTELYLISFIEKLKKDTIVDKLYWEIETADKLNNLEPVPFGESAHPMFVNKTYFEEGEEGYPEEVTRNVFISRAFGYQTFIEGECFNLRLKNGTVLYIMNICKTVRRINDKSTLAKEMWIKAPCLEPEFLCSTKSDNTIGAMLEDLYGVLMEFSKHPRIKQHVQNAIDAFMSDDFEDDVEDDNDLPF